MFWIEALAALLGVLSVGLMARQQPMAWPVGLLMVLLYIVVFWDARLYSETLLQIIYAGLQLYGWWCWRQGTQTRAVLTVSSLAWRPASRDLLLGLMLTLALGTLMSHYTNAQKPWLDAALTGFSLVGQYWMAHKRLQCWPLWVLVDVVYVGLFLSVGLHLTALLYLVFIGLALYGWQQWRTAMQALLAPAGPAMKTP